jgi:hypothetical protein
MPQPMWSLRGIPMTVEYLFACGHMLFAGGEIWKNLLTCQQCVASGSGWLLYCTQMFLSQGRGNLFFHFVSRLWYRFIALCSMIILSCPFQNLWNQKVRMCDQTVFRIWQVEGQRENQIQRAMAKITIASISGDLTRRKTYSIIPPVIFRWIMQCNRNQMWSRIMRTSTLCGGKNVFMWSMQRVVPLKMHTRYQCR